MVKYPRSSMSTLSCKCKLITVMFKFNTITDKFLCNLLRWTYHDLNRSLVILIMTCFHSIFKKSVKITIIPEHTHTALCKKWVALICLILCNNQHICILRKMKCTKQSCCSRSYYDNICLFYHFITWHLFIMSITAYAAILSLYKWKFSLHCIEYSIQACFKQVYSIKTAIFW